VADIGRTPGLIIERTKAAGRPMQQAAAPSSTSLFAGMSAFERCVAWRQSGDNPTASPAGLFGILPVDVVIPPGLHMSETFVIRCDPSWLPLRLLRGKDARDGGNSDQAGAQLKSPYHAAGSRGDVGRRQR
jgi:hypothetical protein